MEQTIPALGKFKGWFKNKFWPDVKEKSKKYQAKSNFVNITVLIVNAISLMTFCSMGHTLAMYEGKEFIFGLSCIAIAILIVVTIWELICVVGVDVLEKVTAKLLRKLQKAAAFLCSCFSNPKARAVSIIMLIMVVCIYHYGHTSDCYTSLSEVYGIPVGVGDKLSLQEQKQSPGYWRVDRYWFRPHITLTYVDAYQQSELLRQYSTVYYMPLFQPVSRIEMDYTRTKGKDRDKYRFDGLISYSTAEDNDFREPTHMSYYSSSGKLLIELRVNEQDALEIVSYSSEDCPQLLNSTLLRVPEGETVKNGILSQQVKVTYNADGLPRTRSLTPHIYNLYGINGEQYTYDQDKRLTSLCYLDINGKPVCNKLGIMMITFQYDEDGHDKVE